MKEFTYSFSSSEHIQSGTVWESDALSAASRVLDNFLALGFKKAAKISIESCS